MFFVSRSGTPPCHPERSGTTHQKSCVTTKHCRTANPAPSGAPAGGISLAKWYHIKHRTTLCPLPRWTVCVTRARLNNGDPACWRPARGAGFDCAALFGYRARLHTRCAASLRMTRGAPDGEAKNKVPYQLVSLCYISCQTNYVSRPCPPRVILSEAAPPAKNHARPPTIAAQRTPPQAGRQQAGSRLLRGTT